MAATARNGKFTCDACQTTSNSEKQRVHHLESYRHKQRVEQLKADPTAPLPVREKPPKRQREGKEEKSKSQKVAHDGEEVVGGEVEGEEDGAKEVAEKKSQVVHCTICKTNYNSMGQYEAHLKGKRHLAGGVKQPNPAQQRKQAKAGNQALLATPRRPLGAGRDYRMPSTWSKPVGLNAPMNSGPAFNPYPNYNYRDSSPNGYSYDYGGSSYGGNSYGGGSYGGNSSSYYPGSYGSLLGPSPAAGMQMGGMGGGGADYTAVFVFHLPTNVDDNMMHDLFGSWGSIHSVKVMRNNNGTTKGFGFVNYYRYEDAERAIANMNGAELEGKHLKVTFKQ